MKSRFIVLLMVIVSLVFSQCKKDDTTCVDGNGSIIQETRDVDNFTRINAKGDYKITYSHSGNSQVDLFGDSNILPIISTPVLGDILYVEVSNGNCYSPTQRIEVTATSENLSGIQLDGSGEIVAYNIVTDILQYVTNGSAIINSSIDVDALSVSISGEGDANLTGNAEEAELLIKGTGSIYASTLEVEECTVVVEGTGSVRIKVTSELNVTITGTGSVYYTGDPDITSNITGTGQLIKEG